MLDAWLNTGMSAPLEMGAVTLTVTASPLIFADAFESGATSFWSSTSP